MDSPAKTHFLDIKEIFKIYDTSFEGLDQIEADKRLKLYGKNTLKEKEESKLIIFLRQFNSVLIYVLFVASLISFFTYKYIDFFAIVFLIFVNGIIGFIQEIKALSSIKALKKLTESKTKIIRNGHILEIPSSMVVPGDIAIFSEGSVVSADVRLFESQSLMVDESLITGESLPVIKDHSAQIPQEALPYELKNTLLSGTTIVRGTSKGIVTKTANNTYLASIAEEKEKSPKSPLTRATELFSKRYAFLLVMLFLIIGIIGFFQNRSWLDLAYILIAELVSALPEGLPIVVTTVLVVGAIALSKKKTLIRYLPAVETLGSATVIASDKTGTITEGKLIVKDHFAFDVSKTKIIASLCNDAKNKIGDPLDIALSNWVEDFEKINQQYPRLKSYPFDVNLRMMATVSLFDGKKTLFIKGAYESLKEIAGNKQDFDELEKHLYSMSDEGLRTIALGYGEFKDTEFKEWKIQIVGIVGFLDPPKSGVKEAVIEAKKANIKVMMITGDFPLTAKAIAKEVEIFKENDTILTGKEIDQMDDKTLYESLKKTTILARILPEHKSRVVKILQANKQIVAVSGDGINDVPALRAADLGIAMGSGTEAAKNVAKMIITDSNLKVIIDAIRNGRIISNNIRKVIYYLLSSGLQEISLISLSILAGLPLPLSPLQILWINIVTDGVQDKTFPFAKEEGNVMDKKPKKPSKQFFDLPQIIYILFFGMIAGFVTFELFKHLLRNYSYYISLTITFTSVVVMQWANGIQAQKENEPFLKNIKKSFTINPFIFLGIAIGIILQLFAIYVATDIFSSVKIPINLWLYPLIMFLVAFFLVEIRKWMFLIRRKK
jgi:Ca2+-transporting ATPase